jgi:hypothetical protein
VAAIRRYCFHAVPALGPACAPAIHVFLPCPPMRAPWGRTLPSPLSPRNTAHSTPSLARFLAPTLRWPVPAARAGRACCRPAAPLPIALAPLKPPGSFHVPTPYLPQIYSQQRPRQTHCSRSSPPPPRHLLPLLTTPLGPLSCAAGALPLAPDAPHLLLHHLARSAAAWVGGSMLPAQLCRRLPLLHPRLFPCPAIFC